MKKELDEWIQTRVENQFIGRVACSTAACVVWVFAVVLVVTDDYAHVGRVVDGIAALLIVLIIALAVIWLVPDWKDS